MSKKEQPNEQKMLDFKETMNELSKTVSDMPRDQRIYICGIIKGIATGFKPPKK